MKKNAKGRICKSDQRSKMYTYITFLVRSSEGNIDANNVEY